MGPEEFNKKMEKKLGDYGNDIVVGYKGVRIVLEPNPSGFEMTSPVNGEHFRTKEEAIRYAKEFIDEYIEHARDFKNGR